MKRIAHTITAIFLFTAACFAQDEALLNGSIAVNASSWQAISFSVTGRTGTVTGRFTAQGSINAYILDADGLTNFRGGAQTETFYNSGNVIVANINVTLPRGYYYLVFRNNNILSAKTVFGNITLKTNSRTSNGSCTVKRGGGNFYRDSDERRIRLRAGTRLAFVEESGNAFFRVRYKRTVGTISGREVSCKY